MKKVLTAVVIALLVILSYAAGRRHTARLATTSLGARRVLYWVDPMHPNYKSDHPGIAPDCGMALEPVYEDSGNAPALQHAAPLPPGGVVINGATQQLLGIQLATVQSSGPARVIRVLGHVVPEDTRVYRINSGMEGFIRETYNDSVGVQVKKDQRLATYYAPDALAVESGFLAATERVPGANGKDGNRTVAFPGAVSKQGVSSIQGYTDRLRNLGMSDVQINQMAEAGHIPESVDVVAPVAGFILARNVTPGQHFDRYTEFYRIADLGRVWIVADVFGSDVQSFRPGAAARIILSNQRKTLSARISDVLPEVDPASRALKLRLEADNPGFALRPDMVVDVELPAPASAGLTVPVDAVIDSGDEQRVFVEGSGGVFEPRTVQTGWHSGDRVEIVHGLAEGERVVVSGTFLVDSESRLKSVGQMQPEQSPHEKLSSRPNIDHGTDVRAGKVKDAACGMMVDAAKAIAEGNTLTRDGITYYFCSDRCKKKFEAQPEHYLALNASGHRP
jgi:Cu(I)/Ag(I) efflux system membrane fusion protein